MNKQEVFDRVVRHLLKQNAPSYAATGCCYRGKDGMKCAIGCLIDDAFYTPELERLNIKDLSVKRAVEKSLNTVVDDNDAYFLYRLQNIHDLTLIGNWKSHLSNIAETEKLTFPADLV